MLEFIIDCIVSSAVWDLKSHKVDDEGGRADEEDLHACVIN